MDYGRQRAVSRSLLVGCVLMYLGVTGRAPVRADPVEAPRETKQAPNVVLVVVDTLRADHLSQYGYDSPTSSSLKRLATVATRFLRAYSTSSWTVPATASIHTGIHPARHRIIRRGASLSRKFHTIAEALHEAGYETLGISHNINVSRLTRYSQGFDTFLDYRGNLAAYPDISEMVDQSIEWLADRKAADPRTPFFLYLQPMNCHGPYKVPESARSVLLSRPPAKGFKYNDRLMRRIMWKGQTDRRKDVKNRYLRSLEEQYDTAVRYSTNQIGRLFDALEENGLWEDTLVIFTSDHGEELFDHGGFTHGYTLYEEVLRVPLIVKMPGQRSSRTRRSLVSLMDIYPTVLEIAGVTPEPGTEGISLEPLLVEPRPAGDQSDAFEDRRLTAQLMWRPRGKIRALIENRFKLIDIRKDYTRGPKRQHLFDLKKDPRERADRAGFFKERLPRMSNLLESLFKGYRKRSYRRPENVLSEMKVEALKALGYIH